VKSQTEVVKSTRAGAGTVALTGYYLLEALNSCAACYYFYYLFFYLQKHFGFTNVGNLTFCALNGFVYVFSAWRGGKFGERHGYFTALTLGFCTMIVALLSGSRFEAINAQIVVMIVWTIGVCFTWPSLEALVTESGSMRHLPRRIGIYNLVWSGAGALTIDLFFGRRTLRTAWREKPVSAPSHDYCFGIAVAWLAGQTSKEKRSIQFDDSSRRIADIRVGEWN
jgi:hypothetical protein